MLFSLRETLREEAETAETGAAPAPDATDAGAWEAVKESIVAKAQEALEEDAGDGGALVADKGAKEPTAKPAKAKVAPPKDEPLEEDQPLDDLKADEPKDEDLGEPEGYKPRSKLERIRQKTVRDKERAEWEAKEAEYRQRLEAMERRIEERGGGLDQARRLLDEGKVDEAIRLLGAKDFADVQRRFLESKGSMSRADRELAELKAERDREKAEQKQRAEEFERQQAIARQRAQQEEDMKDLLDEAARSPYREIRGLAKSQVVSGAFGQLLMQSINTPEFADRDMKFHYQVARNAYRELKQDLDQIFGHEATSPAPSNVRDDSDPHSRTVREAPDQPGASAAKPKSLSQSNQAEARGGARKFSSEQEAWEHHTRSMRAG